jgi:DNA-binding transcriptional LysR family regulator
MFAREQNEGMHKIDGALRIAHVPDSSMVAIKVGEVRQVVVASPAYLAKYPRIDALGDLTEQRIITLSQAGLNAWRRSCDLAIVW